MKNLTIGMAGMLLFMYCFANAQDVEKKAHDHGKMEMDGMKMAPEFKKENLARAFEQYEHIKNALVDSNAGDAQKGAEMMNKALADVEGSEAALSASQKIAATDDLKVQRKAFSELSNELESLLTGTILSGKIYKDYCPMAMGSGAYWLSSVADIRNPYYGAQMLSCGKVAKVIE